MQQDFSKSIQKITETEGEITPERIYQVFDHEYLKKETPYTFVRYRIVDHHDATCEHPIRVEITLIDHGEEKTIVGHGNGPIDSVKNALDQNGYIETELIDYQEHALASGSSAKAAAYVQLKETTSSICEFGAGVDPNINIASIKAIFSAMNRIDEKMKSR